MINSLTNSTNFRLLMPEVIWIEPKQMERATAIRERASNESQQW